MLMAIVYMKEAKRRFALSHTLLSFSKHILMANNFNKYSIVLRTVAHLIH